MYEAAIHYILGFNIEEGYIQMKPCIPKNWKEYKIQYKFGNSIYNILVKNPNLKNTGIDKIIINGEEIKENKIKLEDNGKINNIEVII